MSLRSPLSSSSPPVEGPPCPQHGTQFMAAVSSSLGYARIQGWACQAKYAVLDDVSWQVSTDPTPIKLKYAVCNWTINYESWYYMKQQRYIDPSGHRQPWEYSVWAGDSRDASLPPRPKTEVEGLRSRVENIRKVGREALAI